MNEQGFSPEGADVSEEGNEGLIFVEGWKDILESPDAADYQHQLQSLIDSTKEKVNVEWSKDSSEIRKKWQEVIEKIVYLAIQEDDLREMTPSEIIETALITLTTNLEEIGWIEEGKSFEIPDLSTGEPHYFDLTDL